MKNCFKLSEAAQKFAILISTIKERDSAWCRKVKLPRRRRVLLFLLIFEE